MGGGSFCIATMRFLEKVDLLQGRSLLYRGTDAHGVRMGEGLANVYIKTWR